MFSAFPDRTWTGKAENRDIAIVRDIPGQNGARNRGYLYRLSTADVVISGEEAICRILPSDVTPADMNLYLSVRHSGKGDSLSPLTQGLTFPLLKV